MSDDCDIRDGGTWCETHEVGPPLHDWHPFTGTRCHVALGEPRDQDPTR